MPSTLHTTLRLLLASALAVSLCACKQKPKASALSDAARPRVEPPPIGYDPIKMLESKTRDAVLLPDKAMALLGIKEGMVVADIGSGPGYFTFRMARAAGRKGVVYALEIRKSILATLGRLAKDRKRNPHDNIVLVHNRVDDTNLKPNSLDAALLCEVHIGLRKVPEEDEAKMMASIYRTVKPGGRFLVLELKENDQFTDYVPQNIVDHFVKVGFELEKANKHHTGVAVAFLFRKPR